MTLNCDVAKKKKKLLRDLHKVNRANCKFHCEVKHRHSPKVLSYL